MIIANSSRGWVGKMSEIARLIEPVATPERLGKGRHLPTGAPLGAPLPQPCPSCMPSPTSWSTISSLIGPFATTEPTRQRRPAACAALVVLSKTAVPVAGPNASSAASLSSGMSARRLRAQWPEEARVAQTRPRPRGRPQSGQQLTHRERRCQPGMPGARGAVCALPLRASSCAGRLKVPSPPPRASRNLTNYPRFHRAAADVGIARRRGTSPGAARRSLARLACRCPGDRTSP